MAARSVQPPPTAAQAGLPGLAGSSSIVRSTTNPEQMRGRGPTRRGPPRRCGPAGSNTPVWRSRVLASSAPSGLTLTRTAAVMARGTARKRPEIAARLADLRMVPGSALRRIAAVYLSAPERRGLLPEDDSPADDRCFDGDRCQLGRWDGEKILRQHDEVPELADRERALFVFLESRPGRVGGVGAQSLGNRDR